jgi:hypothetical protein
MHNTETQTKIITALMQPQGIRLTGIEIAARTGMHKTTVYRALNEGIAGVKKDTTQKKDSGTRPGEVYYWDNEAFSSEVNTATTISTTHTSRNAQTIIEAIAPKEENVIQMPIRNNSTALKVTDLSGIPKRSMPHLVNSLNNISPDSIHALNRLKNQLSQFDGEWSPEEIRLQLIVSCGVIMQMCIDMGVQSEEPIAPQANQKDSDNS